MNIETALAPASLYTLIESGRTDKKQLASYNKSLPIQCISIRLRQCGMKLHIAIAKVKQTSLLAITEK